MNAAGLLKDSLRKYWLEQIRGMEAAKAKAFNKSPRELQDMEAVCTVLWPMYIQQLYSFLSQHFTFCRQDC